MIILSKQDNVSSFFRFFEKYPESATLKEKVRVLAYEKLDSLTVYQNETIIFTDFERMSLKERKLADRVFTIISLAEFPFQVINPLDEVLDRLGFLQKCYADGINSFNAYPLEEVKKISRPFFLRSNKYHTGVLSPIIQDQSEVIKYVKKYTRPIGLYEKEDIIAVEYCDTDLFENQYYQKFGAYCLGDQVVLRSLMISPVWEVKGKSRIYNPSIIKTGIDFTSNNIFENKILNIFKHFGMGYGRIDFGLRKGKIEVWEINSCPDIYPARFNKIDKIVTNKSIKLSLLNHRNEFFSKFTEVCEKKEIEVNRKKSTQIQFPSKLISSLASESKSNSNKHNFSRILSTLLNPIESIIQLVDAFKK